MVQIKKKVKLKQKQSATDSKLTLGEIFKKVGLAGLCVLCAILAIIFILRRCENNAPPVPAQQTVDTVSSDTAQPAVAPVTEETRSSDIAPTVVEEPASYESVNNGQVVVEEEKNDKSVTMAEDNKTKEYKTEVQDVFTVSDDVEKEALSVIRGKYGNNPERRRLLKDRYQEIQNKVNEMYRNGLVR